MFLLNAITSRARDRYRQHEQIAQSTSAISTTTRHELVHEIESTLYSASGKSLSSPSSPLSSPQVTSPLLTASPDQNDVGTGISPNRHPLVRRRTMRRGDNEKQQQQLMVIKDLNKTIYQTKETMAKMRESEEFLDTRIRKYRSLLDKQSVKLCSRHLILGNDHIIVRGENNDYYGENSQGTKDSEDGINTGAQYTIDVEKEADIKKQFQQQEENEKKLSAVLDVQKDILTEIEVMRRKLIDLEQRRDSLVLKREECEEFLVRSAEIDMQNEAMANGSMHVIEASDDGIVNRSDSHDSHDSHDNIRNFVTDEDERKIEMTALNQSQNEDNISSIEVV